MHFHPCQGSEGKRLTSRSLIMTVNGNLQAEFIFRAYTCLQGEKNQWQMRRSQKVDKQEILSLQANLQAEIQAKQQLSEEMNKIKAANVGNER